MRWQWSAFDELSLTDLYALMALRQEVFVVEQDCAYLDADGRDAAARHLLGWEGERLGAYLRAFAPGVEHPEAARDMVIGRVITAPFLRGTGLGRPLMAEGHRRCFATWGEGPIHISAQAHLERYYASLGYRVVGPGYDEDGIPHLPMRREEE